MERTLPEDFEPQGPPQTLSTYQLRYKDVIRAQALKWAEQGQVLLVSTPALKNEKNLNFSELVWQPKPGAVLGRTCHNLSKNKNGQFLNTEETKLASDARYGVVVLPSIEKITRGIVQLASDIGVPITELVATKDGVKNALE